MISVLCLLLIGCQDNTKHDITSNDNSTGAVGSSIDETKNIYFTAEMSIDRWDSANMENSAFQSRDEFNSEVKYYIEAISKFLSRENWFDVYKKKHGNNYICHIDYRLTYGASHVENGYLAYATLIPNVYLNKDFFEHDLAPIAHETTHIIVPFYSSLSLREGLASYCQDKFGKNPSVFNWGLDVHAYANFYLVYAKDEFDKVFPVIGSTDKLQKVYAEGNLRELFYNLSHSFTKYLIDNFGIESFMKLYESDDLINDYSVVYGKSFESIKEEWYESLESYSEALTAEEIQNNMINLFTEHNYPINQ